MRFDDYILRAIEQLSQAIARIVGLIKAGSLDDAEQQLGEAYDAALGNERMFLDMVDSGTLSHLLGSPEKVRAVAKLSLLEAQLAERRGDAARAGRLRHRARELAALARRDEPREGDDAWLDELDRRD